MRQWAELRWAVGRDWLMIRRLKSHSVIVREPGFAKLIFTLHPVADRADVYKARPHNVAPPDSSTPFHPNSVPYVPIQRE